jgi:hypothetical protein
MAFIEIDDADWQTLQYILLNGSGAGITPAMAIRLLNKFGAQLQQRARGNGDAAQGLSEQPDTGIVPPRLEAAVETPDHSDSAQQRAARSPRR